MINVKTEDKCRFILKTGIKVFITKHFEVNMGENVKYLYMTCL